MRKIPLTIISLCTMLFLPILVNSPSGEPYFRMGNTMELAYTTTYTRPYHDLLMHLSRLSAEKKPREITEVFVWQDHQGNLHFSDQQQSKPGEIVYQAETRPSGRLAFSGYWVPGFMLATWLAIWLLLYTVLIFLPRHLHHRRKQKYTAGTESTMEAGTPLVWAPAPDHTAYKVLGINANATADEIKAAYSQKIRQYHPDRVAHLGEELQALARKKSAAINQAYQSLNIKETDEIAPSS